MSESTRALEQNNEEEMRTICLREGEWAGNKQGVVGIGEQGHRANIRHPRTATLQRRGTARMKILPSSTGETLNGPCLQPSSTRTRLSLVGRGNG